ncbi:anti-anti-sigma factor [Saccharopolyspora shandongensis]|uniref:Anti-anti-sigma factor n=1 Tax=Saccharopolyspora shandongensis TaxID=418495 RepID=A0A1H3EBA5_9PSEU|nr:STAS domain-containing protein [Saccharopolyspora shandongensis]SDX75887.1 anti-anti-sigma factor [Saccharopolyspora shandongensis]
MTPEDQFPDAPTEEAQAVALRESIRESPVAGSSLQVTFPQPDTIVVTVSGTVDPETVEKLETILWPQPSSTTRLVVIDLSTMYLLNVPDLQLLTHAHMLIQARGGTLRVVTSNSAVQEALHAAGLHALLECHSTIHTALARAAAIPGCPHQDN